MTGYLSTSPGLLSLSAWLVSIALSAALYRRRRYAPIAVREYVLLLAFSLGVLVVITAISVMHVNGVRTCGLTSLVLAGLAMQALARLYPATTMLHQHLINRRIVRLFMRTDKAVEDLRALAIKQREHHQRTTAVVIAADVVTVLGVLLAIFHTDMLYCVAQPAAPHVYQWRSELIGMALVAVFGLASPSGVFSHALVAIVHRVASGGLVIVLAALATVAEPIPSRGGVLLLLSALLVVVLALLAAPLLLAEALRRFDHSQLLITHVTAPSISSSYAGHSMTTVSSGGVSGASSSTGVRSDTSSLQRMTSFASRRTQLTNNSEISSMQATLENLMSDQNGTVALGMYMLKRYTIENLIFLLDHRRLALASSARRFSFMAAPTRRSTIHSTVVPAQAVVTREPEDEEMIPRRKASAPPRFDATAIAQLPGATMSVSTTNLTAGSAPVMEPSAAADRVSPTSPRSPPSPPVNPHLHSPQQAGRPGRRRRLSISWTSPTGGDDRELEQLASLMAAFFESTSSFELNISHRMRLRVCKAWTTYQAERTLENRAAFARELQLVRNAIVKLVVTSTMPGFVQTPAFLKWEAEFAMGAHRRRSSTAARAVIQRWRQKPGPAAGPEDHASLAVVRPARVALRRPSVIQELRETETVGSRRSRRSVKSQRSGPISDDADRDTCAADSLDDGPPEPRVHYPGRARRLSINAGPTAAQAATLRALAESHAAQEGSPPDQQATRSMSRNDSLRISSMDSLDETACNHSLRPAAPPHDSERASSWS